ncbi:MAG: hypothetical protein M3Q34_03270 [bacterium]|nr:hypothetical protein [bacterium]
MDQAQSPIIKPEEKIEWLAPQYEHKQQSVDWFWALGIIIVATTIASIILENYFFAILILIGGTLLWHFSIIKPAMVDYELNQKGFKIKNRMHPYENIKHFWVQKGQNPILHVQSERFFLPTLSIPIYPNIADKIRDKMISKGVIEQEIPEHPSVKVMEYLGF